MTAASPMVKALDFEAKTAAQIRQALQAGESEAMILDMIEGSSNLHEALGALSAEVIEAEIQLEGLKVVLGQLGDRKARIAKTIETLKAIQLAAMDKAGVKTSKGPLATLSVRPTPPKVIVTNEAEIPAAYFKTPDPTLDKSALGDALAAGETIPGAVLSNGGITLAFRKA